MDHTTYGTKRKIHKNTGKLQLEHMLKIMGKETFTILHCDDSKNNYLISSHHCHGVSFSEKEKNIHVILLTL